MLSNFKMFNKLPKQRGAILVISLILLVVLAGLSVAAMSIALTSSRSSQHYSKFLEAQTRAVTMANYAKRILESYNNGQYPEPGTCNSIETCNVIISGFPHNGRPRFVWTSGINLSDINGLQTDEWWTQHGFAYEGAFSGGGNARVIVYRTINYTEDPYYRAYKIVGYGTDATGSVRATSTLYHTALGFKADPYPKSGTNLYGTSGCSNGCPYGSCCNAGTCSTSAASCNSASATFTPPGWTCSQYFVAGLGYNSSTCNNSVAKIYDALYAVTLLREQAEAYYNTNSSFPVDLRLLGYSLSGNALPSYTNSTGLNYINSSAIGAMGSAAACNGAGTEQPCVWVTIPGAVIGRASSATLVMAYYPAQSYIWRCTTERSDIPTVTLPNSYMIPGCVKCSGIETGCVTY